MSRRYRATPDEKVTAFVELTDAARLPAMRARVQCHAAARRCAHAFASTLRRSICARSAYASARRRYAAADATRYLVLLLVARAAEEGGAAAARFVLHSDDSMLPPVWSALCQMRHQDDVATACHRYAAAACPRHQSSARPLIVAHHAAPGTLAAPPSVRHAACHAAHRYAVFFYPRFEVV